MIHDAAYESFHYCSFRYLIMWEYMKLRRALVPNTQSAIERVLKGKYAFIHDAPVLQYQTRKMHCGQIKLIGGFDEKYGVS